MDSKMVSELKHDEIFYLTKQKQKWEAIGAETRHGRGILRGNLDSGTGKPVSKTLRRGIVKRMGWLAPLRSFLINKCKGWGKILFCKQAHVVRE
jgi:hypothetical protein